METRVSNISRLVGVWLPVALAVLFVTTGITTLALGPAADAPGKIAALDPRGIRPSIQRIPLSPRPKLLDIVPATAQRNNSAASTPRTAS
jgi:hypothetical protein